MTDPASLEQPPSRDPHTAPWSLWRDGAKNKVSRSLAAENSEGERGDSLRPTGGCRRREAMEQTPSGRSPMACSIHTLKNSGCSIDTNVPSQY